tara:strand:- start:1527 stop:1859 length:333 start_codon:yes stop_codon:yes gene_type:complete
MTSKPTEDHIKEVEQDDRIIQFDNGEIVKDPKFITQFDNEVASADVLRAIERIDEESKRSDRFFGMRLNGKSIDDIENKFLAMFAEFVSLMALFIGMLGFGVLLWAIFGG